jgi:hypothetical protein
MAKKRELENVLKDSLILDIKLRIVNNINAQAKKNMCLYQVFES